MVHNSFTKKWTFFSILYRKKNMWKTIFFLLLIEWILNEIFFDWPEVWCVQTSVRRHIIFDSYCVRASDEKSWEKTFIRMFEKLPEQCESTWASSQRDVWFFSEKTYEILLTSSQQNEIIIERKLLLLTQKQSLKVSEIHISAKFHLSSWLTSICQRNFNNSNEQIVIQSSKTNISDHHPQYEIPWKMRTFMFDDSRAWAPVTVNLHANMKREQNG